MLKISSQFQALLFQKLMASVFKIILIYRIIYHTKTVQLHSTELTALTQSGKFQWKEASLTMNLYTAFYAAFGIFSSATKSAGFLFFSVSAISLSIAALAASSAALRIKSGSITPSPRS